MRISNKQDLLDLICDRHPSLTCRRAVKEGKTELLGMFGNLSNNFWIVRVLSTTGTEWLVRIKLPAPGLVKIGTVYKVPWEAWNEQDDTHPLWRGDEPLDYAERRDAALNARSGNMVQQTDRQKSNEADAAQLVQEGSLDQRRASTSGGQESCPANLHNGEDAK